MAIRLENVRNLASIQNANGYSFEIQMEYLPELSVNHYKHFGTGFTKSAVKRWMEDLSGGLYYMGRERGIRWPDYKITVRIDAFFKYNRVADVHNFLKIVCDSVEDCTLVNDKLYATECGTPEIGEPKLIITVTVERED